MKRRTTIFGAAYDLGLTEEARQEYRRRLSQIFAEGCAIFGSKAAAKIFREQAKALPKPVRGKRRPVAPPRKRRGPHDPEGDRMLLQLWKTGRNGMTKRAFAKVALKNHAVKIGGKVRGQDKILVDSMVRRLNRVIRREAEVRQLGRSVQKT
jgi:hypothetical protein